MNFSLKEITSTGVCSLGQVSYSAAQSLDYHICGCDFKSLARRVVSYSYLWWTRLGFRFFSGFFRSFLSFHQHSPLSNLYLPFSYHSSFLFQLSLKKSAGCHSMLKPWTWLAAGRYALDLGSCRNVTEKRWERVMYRLKSETLGQGGELTVVLDLHHIGTICDLQAVWIDGCWWDSICGLLFGDS